MTEERCFGNQTGAMMNGRLVKCCLICGALAGDIPRHVRFHEILTTLILGETVVGRPTEEHHG
jgi:hypothetical protein